MLQRPVTHLRQLSMTVVLNERGTVILDLFSRLNTIISKAIICASKTSDTLKATMYDSSTK